MEKHFAPFLNAAPPFFGEKAPVPSSLDPGKLGVAEAEVEKS